MGRLLERVAQLAGAAFDDWTRQTRASLAAVGKQQGEAAAQVLVATLGDEAKDIVKFGGPNVNMMKAIIDEDPFQGEILAQWAKNQAAATVRRVRQQTQLGMVHEETIDQLVRRIRGKSDGKGGFMGGVLQTTTREAEAIVRTAVTHVATRAALDTYRANEDITKEWQFVATLDSRTTPICQSLDGKTFRYDDPSAPKPPRHFNCRSHAAPVVDWESLGIDPPDPGTRAARDPTTGTTVQVSATLDYEAWLKQQPASFQDEVLGPTRAKLFREGKVTLGDLVRSDGTVVRLDQLPGAPQRVRARRAEFLKAGEADGTTAARATEQPKAQDRAKYVWRETADEAVQYAKENLARLVRMEGLHISRVNSIVDGVSRVLSLTGTRVDSILVVDERQFRLLKHGGSEGAIGFYSPNRGGGDAIVLHREWVRSAPPGGSGSLSVGRKAEALRKASRDPVRKEAIAAATRWALVNDARNPVSTAASHEAAHAIFRRADIDADAAWRETLDRHQVSLRERYGVSMYAATSDGELWAETVAALVNNRMDIIGPNLLAAVKDMLGQLTAARR
ncbi:MAG: minor capsid protein [Gemmatimonadetes bacterium]|nr:minor capsid protein [Gemmatimonadota bacterium]